METLPLFPSRIICSINMLLHARRLQPRTPVLLKRLNPRFELRLLQRKIINRTDPRNTSSRISRAPPVHERAADTAETILHVIARSNRLLLSKSSELILATQVLHVRVFYHKIGGEHAG